MAANSDRMERYLQHRISGNDPVSSAQLAGYSASNIKATASRLEQREDVRTALRVAKRGAGKRAPLLKATLLDDDPDSSGDSNRLEPWKLKPHYANPLDLLRDVMNNPKAPGGLRIQCAKDALPYCHARKESSKKDEKQEAAEKAAKSNVFAGQVTPMRKAA